MSGPFAPEKDVLNIFYLLKTNITQMRSNAVTTEQILSCRNIVFVNSPPEMSQFGGNFNGPYGHLKHKRLRPSS